MARTLAPQKALIDRITVDGREVTLRGQDIPIDKVTLDPSNPRLANSILADLGGAEADEVQKMLEETLWSDPNVRELYRQVQVNRGLTERVIIREDGTVVEGNCRTVVYRRLHKQFPKDDTWQKLPARVLPAQITDREVAILQGEMHVAGKITWSSFEKAGHVFSMHNDHMMTQDEIATRLRMSKSKVNQLIRAFETMQVKYLKRYPGAASVHKFSYFEEFFKNPLLRARTSKDPELVDKFVDWVGTGKIPEGKHVRQLPEILENKHAAKALERGGFIPAVKVLESDNPALTSSLYRAMEKATLELRDASAMDIDELRNGNQAAIRLVDELSNALHSFRELAGLNEK